jgi:hypothetical protein
LDMLRDWYCIARPAVWLFPGRDPMLPMTTRQLTRAVHIAARLVLKCSKRGVIWPERMLVHAERDMVATQKTSVDRRQAVRKPTARSRVSNGRDVQPIARRHRGIAGAILADQGGVDQCSESRQQLIRRFAAAAADDKPRIKTLLKVWLPNGCSRPLAAYDRDAAASRTRNSVGRGTSSAIVSTESGSPGPRNSAAIDRIVPPTPDPKRASIAPLAWAEHSNQGVDFAKRCSHHLTICFGLARLEAVLEIAVTVASRAARSFSATFSRQRSSSDQA